MNLKEELMKVLEQYQKDSITEGIESSKDMLDTNVTSFEAIGMTSEKPGTFSEKEITDPNNLINKGNLQIEKEPVEKMSFTIISNTDDEVVDISAPEEENELDIDDMYEDDADILDIIRNYDASKEDCPCKQKEPSSKFGKSIFEAYQSILKESDYAGPLDFVPDTRINASDVIRTLKGTIGKGSEALGVEKEVDSLNNPIYKVYGIDLSLLPDTIKIETVTLVKKDKDTYIPEKIEEFPIRK